MPSGTCYCSARLLAALYPELRYAQGDWTVTFADGEVRVIKHAWCVAADGAIVDPTAPAARPAGTVYTYAEKPGHVVNWPDNWAELEELVKRRTACLSPAAKRAEIEEAGQMLMRAHERELGRPYRAPWDRRYTRAERAS
jgi:hypothetical protein